jgi:hypothetical protein
MKRISLLMLIILNVIALGIDPVLAGQVGTLIDFDAGTPAVADDVDQNFNTVAAEVNDNAADINDNAAAINDNAAAINDNAAAINVNAAAISDNDERLDAMSSGYVSVSAVTAVPRDSTYETNQTNVASAIGRYAVGGGTEYLLAPLFIPDGATITSFSYTCYDNDTSYNSTAYLYRDDSVQVAEAISTSSSSTTLQTVTTTNITYPSVDNSLYGYFVYMRIHGTAGTNLVPIRVVVAYTR